MELSNCPLFNKSSSWRGNSETVLLRLAFFIATVFMFGCCSSKLQLETLPQKGVVYSLLSARQHVLKEQTL